MREQDPINDGAAKLMRPRPDAQQRQTTQVEEQAESTEQALLTQRLQQQYGHDVVSGALSGEDTSAMGTLVLAEWALGTSGLDSLVDGPTGSSNAVFGILHSDEWAASSAATLSRHETSSQPGHAHLAADLIRRSRGQRLPTEVAARLSAALGTDISDAVIHTDSAAAQAAAAVNAHAFATGRDVFFGAGKYKPGSREGDELLAHELTHVVQDSEGRIPQASGEGLTVSSPSDSHEREATTAGREAMDVLHGAGGFDLEHASGDIEANGGLTDLTQKTGQDERAVSRSEDRLGESEQPETEPGSAVVAASAQGTEYAYDNSYSPALLAALESNPSMSVDEILEILGDKTLAVQDESHSPTTAQYGQTEENTSVCRINEREMILVANQNYDAVSDLGTPIVEANALHSEFGKRGYSGDVLNDQTSSEMRSAYGDMINNASEGDDLLAFYGGHGTMEGLVGVSHAFNQPDILTNAEISTLVSKATAKGAHIRFIMDSCHSGEAAAVVRDEIIRGAAQEQSESSPYLGTARVCSALRVQGVQIYMRRNAALNKLDITMPTMPQGEVSEEEVEQYDTAVENIETAKEKVRAKFDRLAQEWWTATVAYLNEVASSIAKKTDVEVGPFDETIFDIETLEREIDACDMIANLAIKAHYQQ